MPQLIGHRAVAAGAILAAALLAAGCASNPASSTGSGSGSSASASTGSDPKSLVPADIKSKGTLIVATDASYAPNEFFDTDGKTIIGMDADLAQALGQELGLKVTVQNVTFDSIIAGLAANKYDLGMSSFTDTKEREKTVDFVTYFSAGSSLMVKAGNPEGLKPNDVSLCGKTIAVEKGTIQESTDVPADTKTCTAAGKPAVKDLSFDDQNGANLALDSGRADGVLADSPVAAYAAKQSNGKFVITGQPYGTAPYGIAIPKGNGMAPAVLAALKVLMTNGSYTQILTKWGIQDGAITNPVIDGATS
ncbi:ABC transporter substrate-binding protein [Actinocrinis puniceicyclus]|uniref:ABC transporter substrate-binding protein n=1 Tax=Actinocrinis puniceicyclus TaxID=977794 RepID=A0A8J8BC27_9ACTN|nr:ABC transporter substrate-binding protein [Actinocrinis puniceicyclus]MBS2962691.1 ABC transporter substrate-binding protein [Actinocrinis puniceicyclus]